MGTFAKIFIVVNLVLAVVFLGAASTLLGTAEDYKDKHDTLLEETSAQKKKMQDEIATLRADNNKYKGEKTQWMNRNETLETTIQRDAETYKGLTEKLNVLVETNKGHVESLRDLNDGLKKAVAQNAVLEKQYETAQADMRKAKDDADNLRNDGERLAVQVKNLTGDLAQAEKDMALVNADNATMTSLLAQIKARIGTEAFAGIRKQEPVDALVARVDEDLNIVLISIGTDDKLAVGDIMTVFRGKEYVGRLIIDKTGDDWASGHMDMGYTKTFPLQGDSASTRL